MLEQRAFGCFGFVTTFERDSETCQSCPARRQCEVKAYQALKAMSAELDVTELLARFYDQVQKDREPLKIAAKKPKSRRNRLKQYAQTQDSVELAKTLPNKERQIVVSIAKKGIMVKALLRAGVNPFERHRPAFLKVPCRLILERGQFSRQELKEALQVSFPHWSEATAETNASVALRVLVALDVLQKQNDRYFKVD